MFSPEGAGDPGLTITAMERAVTPF